MARALVDTAVAAARAQGVRVVLDVVEGTAAVGLYERWGWRLADRRPAGWTAPDGREPTSRVYLSPGPATGSPSPGTGAAAVGRRGDVRRPGRARITPWA